jgi:hypothetical protein
VEVCLSLNIYLQACRAARFFENVWGRKIDPDCARNQKSEVSAWISRARSREDGAAYSFFRVKNRLNSK